LDVKSIKNNIVKLVVDEEVDDVKLEKVTNLLNKLKPWQLTIDYNVTNKSLNDVESVDSINIKEMFDEFYEQLGLDEDQLKRIKEINEELYKNNKN
jgi:hypothetical protein